MKRPSKDQETCFSCYAILSDCKCGNTQTFDDSEGPICPYCGYQSKACDSDGYLYNEDKDDCDCDDCGRLFQVSTMVTFSWTSKRFGCDD